MQFVDTACFNRRKGSGTMKIKDCTQCLRYGYPNCSKPISDAGALKLGYEIIYQRCNDYVIAYRDCQRGKLLFLDKWFRSKAPTILSAEEYNGVAMLENLQKKCLEKYGDFEERYTKFQKEHKQKIKELLVQLKNASTRQERARLKTALSRERALLNG